MAIPAEEMAVRAARWAQSDPAVRAAVVYGSLARGAATEDSDLDLIIVAEPGQRETLWERRRQISAALLGRPAVWSQEPAWQRPFRYQSWDDRLAELDLTLDEEYVRAWPVLARGFRALVDKAGVAERLATDLASLEPPELDAPAHDRTCTRHIAFRPPGRYHGGHDRCPRGPPGLARRAAGPPGCPAGVACFRRRPGPHGCDAGQRAGQRPADHDRARRAA